MATFIATLKKRNAVLYGFGSFCLISSIICLLLAGVTTTQVLGINAFVKPAKFFVSVGLFCWTMAWYMKLLPQRSRVTAYSWAVVVIMVLELSAVTGQAALGKLSHFNVSSAFDGILFALMGIGITILPAGRRTWVFCFSGSSQWVLHPPIYGAFGWVFCCSSSLRSRAL